MEEKILKEVSQYKIDLAKDLSEILTKALLKPAAIEQLVAGTHIFDRIYLRCI